MGLGVDLVGEDATKAARRAVREAIGRTSLPGVRDLIPSRDRADMRVDVTIAVPGHEGVDAGAVAAEFPYGRVSVRAEAGGLRMPNGTDAARGGPPDLRGRRGRGGLVGAGRGGARRRYPRPS